MRPANRGSFPPIAARDPGRQQIELQKVAPRLQVPRIERQRGIDLFAEAPGQQQLLKGVGVLRHDALHFGQLAMIPGGAAVERDGFLGEGKGCGTMAEGVADLGKKKVRQRVAGSLANPRLDERTRLFPVARFDQLFGSGGLGAGRRGTNQIAEMEI